MALFAPDSVATAVIETFGQQSTNNERGCLSPSFVRSVVQTMRGDEELRKQKTQQQFEETIVDLVRKNCTDMRNNFRDISDRLQACDKSLGRCESSLSNNGSETMLKLESARTHLVYQNETCERDKAAMRQQLNETNTKLAEQLFDSEVFWDSFIVCAVTAISVALPVSMYKGGNDFSHSFYWVLSVNGPFLAVVCFVSGCSSTLYKQLLNAPTDLWRTSIRSYFSGYGWFITLFELILCSLPEAFQRYLPSSRRYVTHFRIIVAVVLALYYCASTQAPLLRKIAYRDVIRPWKRFFINAGTVVTGLGLALGFLIHTSLGLLLIVLGSAFLTFKSHSTAEVAALFAVASDAVQDEVIQKLKPMQPALPGPAAQQAPPAQPAEEKASSGSSRLVDLLNDFRRTRDLLTALGYNVGGSVDTQAPGGAVMSATVTDNTGLGAIGL